MALAQIAPAEDATQELLRQQERERALRQRQESKPDVRLERGVAAETGRLPADESPCFRIDRITLTGDAAERFQWALPAADPSDDPATGRCLGTAGINLVMKRVQNAIVARGYVTTRVLAAPQDLKQGTLALTLVPGRIRAIRFSDDSSPRATRWNALPAAPGDILNLRDIEQGLENFKRVPTADADIQIAPADGPGATPGESDLVIAWKQGLPFRLNVAADDSGSKYTGKYQGSVTVSYDHWWTLNDLFYASFNHDLGGGYSGSKGTRGYTVHYEVPYDYWLLGFTTSSYDYYQSVVGGQPDLHLQRHQREQRRAPVAPVLPRRRAQDQRLCARLGAQLRQLHRRHRDRGAAPPHGRLGNRPEPPRVHRCRHARRERGVPQGHGDAVVAAGAGGVVRRGHRPPVADHGGCATDGAVHRRVAAAALHDRVARPVESHAAGAARPLLYRRALHRARLRRREHADRRSRLAGAQRPRLDARQ
ncbi:activation/secretion protein [Ralstonia solanacearum SD54]|nr:activation/secretion protein [Ralstonia solanacearum SD54]